MRRPQPSLNAWSVEARTPSTVYPLPPAAAFEGTPSGEQPRMLVLEIGTEELPPGEARATRTHLQRELTERLGATRLAHGDVRVHATPRRLIAVVADVAAREQDHVRTVKGPRAGAPESAVAGFARSQGVAVESLSTADVNGVPHLVVHRHEAGRAAPAVLAEVLAKVVGGLRSPYLDVPTSTWFGSSTGASFCGIAGHEDRFDQATLDRLYPTRGAYVSAVVKDVLGLVAQRYITARDGLELIREAAHTDIRTFGED